MVIDKVSNSPHVSIGELSQLPSSFRNHFLSPLLVVHKPMKAHNALGRSLFPMNLDTEEVVQGTVHRLTCVYDHLSR